MRESHKHAELIDIVKTINLYFHYQSLSESFHDMAEIARENGDHEDVVRLCKDSIKYAKYAMDVKRIIIDEFKEELED